MSKVIPLVNKNLTELNNKGSLGYPLDIHFTKINNRNYNLLHSSTSFQNKSHFVNHFINDKKEQNNDSDSEFPIMNPNISINANNININSSNIINNNFYINEKMNEIQFITMNDIIGEKCDIKPDILNLFFTNYEDSKVSKKKMGHIISYGVNTYQGIVRTYNEDRVSIIINMNKPKDYTKGKWPKISFFGIYDGHGGEGCSEYLRDNLHKLICNNEYFPENVIEAIKLGISKAEEDFLNNHALSPNKEEIKDKSGSCALILLLVENNIYIVNVGDSRCLVSKHNGNEYKEVTKDHRPNSPNESIRIKNNGGSIYQSQTLLNNIGNEFYNGKILIGPYRVLPGRLSVCRTIGDAESKIAKFGGIPGVIISEPDIFCYDLSKDDIDFFILGCDGIYDQMTNKEVLDCAWTLIKENEKEEKIKEPNDLHILSGKIVNYIIKSSLARKSFDNVTCLFVSFKDFYKKSIIEKNFNFEIQKSGKNIKINPIITKGLYENKSEGKNMDKPNINKKVNKLSKDSINDFKTDGVAKYRTNKNTNRFIFQNNQLNKSNILYNENKTMQNNDIEMKTLQKINNTNLSMKELKPGKQNYRKIQAKPLVYKDNIESDIINRFPHNKAKTGQINYPKKNQSYTKVNKYILSVNNYRQGTSKYTQSNIYNTHITKKLSERNTKQISHVFKPLSNYNWTQKPKVIEPKRSYTNSYKILNLEKKKPIMLQNITNIRKVNSRAFRNLLIDKNNKEKKIISYISFGNKLNEKLNNTQINTNQIYNNKNSFITNNNRNNISLIPNRNNTQNLDKQDLLLKPNISSSSPNTILINSAQHNAFTTRIKRSNIPKSRKIYLQQPLPVNDSMYNFQTNSYSNHNISAQDIQLVNHINRDNLNLREKNEKNKNKIFDKDYDFLINYPKNKHNSYLMTDLEGKNNNYIFQNFK